MAARALTRLHYARGKQLKTAWQENTRLAIRSLSGPAGSPGNISGSSQPSLSTEELPLDGKGIQNEEVPPSSAIKATDNKGFEASIKVDAPFMRFVAGRRGTTKERIEKETKTELRIPSIRELRSNPAVVVKGPSQVAVDAAIKEVQRVVQRAERTRGRQPSHFISVPLLFPELAERMKSFQNSVLAEEREASEYVSWFPGPSETMGSTSDTNKSTKIFSKVASPHAMDPDLEGVLTEDDIESSGEESDAESVSHSGRRIFRSFFVRPSRLHVSVVMMRLFNEDRFQAALQVLEGVKDKVLDILDGRPVTAHLQGMEVLRGSPQDARVLCMRVREDQDDRLVRACQAIADAYYEAKLISDVERKFKLHAVVMNAAYQTRNGSFDARKILTKHRLEDWGQYSLDGVHLSQRFAYDDNGYNHSCSSIAFPSAAT